MISQGQRQFTSQPNDLHHEETIFGPVPDDYILKKYALSTTTIDNSLSSFQKYAPPPQGLLSVDKLNIAFKDVFANEGMPSPDPIDVAYLLKKYGFGNDKLINYREFKRMLKELASYRAYERDEISEPGNTEENRLRKNQGYQDYQVPNIVPEAIDPMMNKRSFNQFNSSQANTQQSFREPVNPYQASAALNPALQTNLISQPTKSSDPSNRQFAESMPTNAPLKSQYPQTTQQGPSNTFEQRTLSNQSHLTGNPFKVSQSIITGQKSVGNEDIMKDMVRDPFFDEILRIKVDEEGRMIEPSQSNNNNQSNLRTQNDQSQAQSNKKELTEQQSILLEQIYTKTDTENRDALPIPQVFIMIREFYNAQGFRPPDDGQIGLVLLKYGLDITKKISKIQFRRLIKELMGVKAYDYENFFTMKPSITPDSYANEPRPIHDPELKEEQIQNQEVATILGPVPKEFQPRDYQLPHDAVGRAKSIFKKYDLGNKKYIGILQAKKAMDEIFETSGKPPLTDMDLAYILRKYGMDKNYSLSKHEFISLVGALAGKVHNPTSKLAFMKSILHK